jgi:hypothetical protein
MAEEAPNRESVRRIYVAAQKDKADDKTLAAIAEIGKRLAQTAPSTPQPPAPVSVAPPKKSARPGGAGHDVADDRNDLLGWVWEHNFSDYGLGKGAAAEAMVNGLGATELRNLHVQLAPIAAVRTTVKAAQYLAQLQTAAKESPQALYDAHHVTSRAHMTARVVRGEIDRLRAQLDPMDPANDRGMDEP